MLTLKTRSACRKHERRHIGDKRFPCALCGKRFMYSIDLEKHKNRKYKCSDEKPISCSHCEHRFKTRDACRNHEQQKHNVEKQVRTKLTNKQKLDLIEDSQKSGFCIEEAKSKYSLSRASVYRILRKKDKAVRPKLTNKLKLELIEDSQKSGFCIEDAISKYSLSKSSVYRILQNKEKIVKSLLPARKDMNTTRTPNSRT